LTVSTARAWAIPKIKKAAGANGWHADLGPGSVCSKDVIY
jgi:hypothetical protein